MLLFIIKTIVCFGIMYCATRFYGNVSDNLLLKAFLCLVIMFATYWVDVYRFSSIFLNYYLALRNYRKGKYNRAFATFEELLGKEFAPSLPYLARMRFEGLGTNINIDAAKFYCERAIRNDFSECLYLLAVINFFGDNLTEYFYSRNSKNKADRQNSTIKTATEENTKPLRKNTVTKKRRTNTYKSEMSPDYNECVFHLHSFLEKASETDANYGDACALLAYCLYTGKGVPKNIEQSNALFNHATMLSAKNVKYLRQCAIDNIEVANYVM